MVRTKADAAVRVAAGGKAPKKTANRVQHSPSPSPTDKVGKDNLPVNRYCPREIPAWQKKITFFYDKNAAESETKMEPENKKVPDENTIRRSKRSSSELDDSSDMMTTENQSLPKKIKKINDMETDFASKEIDENQSMEMDE